MDAREVLRHVQPHRSADRPGKRGECGDQSRAHFNASEQLGDAGFLQYVGMNGRTPARPT